MAVKYVFVTGGVVSGLGKGITAAVSYTHLITAVKTLEYLADYTEFHFGEEEKLQAEIAYPGIEEHKAEHKKLIQVVEDLSLIHIWTERTTVIIRESGSNG